MLNREVGLSRSPARGHMRGESSSVVTGIAYAACRSGPHLAAHRIMPGPFVAKWFVALKREENQGEGT